MSFLVLRALETEISPVLISPTTTNQDQASNEVLRHAKKHHIHKLLQRTSALLDSLSPSLSCLHPCHGKELWKVFQLCSNSIYLPSSSGLTMGNKKSFLPPVPGQSRRQLLFLANPRGEGEFLWILWLTWDGLDSHPLFLTIFNTPCASLHNTTSFHGTTGINV